MSASGSWRSFLRHICSKWTHQLFSSTKKYIIITTICKFKMLMLLICITMAIWITQYRYKRRHLYRLAAKIPIVKGNLPIIGTAHKFITGESAMSAFRSFSYDSMKHDGIACVWLVNLPYFVVVNPLDLEYILKTCIEKDDILKFAKQITGNGSIFAPATIWKRRRKVMVPVFSPKIVENFVHVFVEQSQKLVKKLSSKETETKFDIWQYLTTFTLDSVCETTLGVKVNSQDNPDSLFLNTLIILVRLVRIRTLFFWLHYDGLFGMLPENNLYKRSLQIVKNFADEVIRKKRNEMKNEKTSVMKINTKYDLSLYKNKNFLDVMINLSGGENGFTDVELREETLTLIIAGNDTSAVGSGFTILLLAKFPDVQEKLYQEIYDIFGDSNRSLVKEDLLKLNYMERVIKESLRLFPPVPVTARKVTEDTKLPSGRVLPAGSGVVCSIWGIHRDPKYWGADAENFDPDRFLPERFNIKYPSSFQPFSYGPRNCIGYQYAMASMKTLLTTILREYKIVGEREKGPVPKIRVSYEIMMKPVEGYQIALRKREKLVK